MATKPKSRGASKKTTAAASKKVPAATRKVAVKKVASKKVASKKVAVKKAVARKVPVKKVAKKAIRRKGPVSNTLINVTVPLGYTIGVLGVTNGVASLTIDGVPFEFDDQTGFPVCFVFPIAPTHARDAEYLNELRRAAEELAVNVLGVKECPTCCKGP